MYSKNCTLVVHVVLPYYYCYYCKRVLILANFSDFVIIAKFCPR